MPALTILIQDRVTKKLLKTPRTWARNIAEARSFPSALSAFYFAAEHQLRDVEVVCVHTEPEAAKEIVGENRLKVRNNLNARSAASTPARYAEWPETVLHRHQHRTY